MRHSRTEAILGGKTCTLHIEDNAKVLLLQPVDGHDREELEQQIESSKDSLLHRNTIMNFYNQWLIINH